MNIVGQESLIIWEDGDHMAHLSKRRQVVVQIRYTFRKKIMTGINLSQTTEWQMCVCMCVHMHECVVCVVL